MQFNQTHFSIIYFGVDQEKIVYGETHSRIVGTLVEISVRVTKSVEERQTSCHQVG